MRHLLILTLLLLINGVSYSQDNSKEEEEKVKRARIYKVEKYKTDTNNITFLSGVISYDTIGRIVREVYYDEENEVEEENRTVFIGDTIVITSYHEADLIDTSIDKLDNLGRNYYEYWYWSDDKQITESWYYYKGNTDTLLVSIEKYVTGIDIDSFFYKEGNLIQVLTYREDKLNQAQNYKYTNGVLLLKTCERLNGNNHLLSKETYFYDRAGNKIKTVIEYFTYKMLIEYYFRYDSHKMKRFEKRIIYDNGKITRIIEDRYSKSGLKESNRLVYTNGKHEKVRYKYYSFK
jgi:hypothetical protein